MKVPQNAENSDAMESYLELAPNVRGRPQVSIGEADITHWKQSHARLFEVLWQTSFHVYDEIDTLMRPWLLNVQRVSSPEYCSHHQYRTDENHCYFCYTLKGRGLFEDDNGTHVLGPGQAFLMEIDDSRAFYQYPPGATEEWEFLAFEFKGFQSRMTVRALTDKYGSVFTIPRERSIIQRLLGMEVSGYVRADIHAVDGAEIVFELLMTAAATARDAENDSGLTDLVRKATQRINSDTDGSVTVQSLADELGVSREHLSRVCQERLGQPPSQILQENRIRRACYLLKETKLPLKSVARQVGYSSPPNFSRAFQQLMQMTPYEFRLRGTVGLASLLPASSTRI